MDTKQTQHSADSDHEISVLPKEIWRDDGNPVADTAKMLPAAMMLFSKLRPPLKNKVELAPNEAAQHHDT